MKTINPRTGEMVDLSELLERCEAETKSDADRQKALEDRFKPITFDDDED